MAFSGDRLAELRRQAGQSRERLAVGAGVSISSLISYEQGNSVPSVDRAQALADALGISLPVLLRDLETASAA